MCFSNDHGLDNAHVTEKDFPSIVPFAVVICVLWKNYPLPWTLVSSSVKWTCYPALLAFLYQFKS